MLTPVCVDNVTHYPHHISAAMPPYIPSVCAPDDTANFDEFETQRDCGDDHLTPPLSQRGQRGFSGRTLPFVGFTFTRMDSVNLDLNVTDQEHKYVSVICIECTMYLYAEANCMYM